MTPIPPLAVALIQAGALLGVVLLGQAIAVRHLPVQVVPVALRARLALSNRLRPWLVAVAATMTVSGLLLLVV